MKHTLLACALALTTSLSAAAFAGAHSDHEGMHERHMERMTQELGLTAQQQEQIGNLNKGYAERSRDMRQAHREEVRKLLDAEQQAKMDAMREQRREQMIQRHADHARGDHGHSNR
jgi:Spy/CpxP family protein refolding chaperone